MPMHTQTSLRSGPLQPLLDRLHRAAGRQLPRAVWQFARMQGRRLIAGKASRADEARFGSGLFLAVEPAAGQFLYQVARLTGAQTIVEFGTSYGISTLYLAAALKDNGGGKVIATELDPQKCDMARHHFAEAGLSDFIELRQGDALETLQDLPACVDLALLDGWKDLYLPVIRLIEPSLKTGSVVLADNITMFKRALAPYVQDVQAGGSYVSQTLPLGSGLEISTRL